MKICLIGSSELSIPSFEEILKIPGSSVVLVITRADKPKGRKLHLTPSPIKVWAQQKGIPVLTPEEYNKEDIAEFLKYNFDLITVCYYGLLIPLEIIDHAKFGGINAHPSLLPDYAGSSPGVWAILNGESCGGITLLKVNEVFDAGEIIYQESFQIKEEFTSEDYYEKAFSLAPKLFVQAIKEISEKTLLTRPQEKRPRKYARKLTKEDGHISFKENSPEQIDRMIRALNPWPGCWALESEFANSSLIANQEIFDKKSSKIVKIKKHKLRNGKVQILDFTS